MSGRAGEAPRLAAFYGGIFLVLGVYGVFWPVWLSDRGLAPEDIGLITALGVASKLLTTPIATGWADRWGARRRPILLLATAASFFFACLYPMRDFVTIAVLMVLFFAFWGPIMPLTESLTMLTRRATGMDYGRVRLWGSVTFIIGAVGMGYILDAGKPDDIHWTITATLVLTLIAAFALPRAPTSAKGTTASIETPSTNLHSTQTGRTSYAQAMKVPGLLAAMVGASAIQASHALYYSFGTLHWQAAGHSDALIGWLWSVGIVFEIALFAFSGRVVGRIGALPLILLGGAAGAIRWFATGLTTDPILLIPLQALHALSFGATHLGMIHYISDRVAPSLSATGQGLYAIILGVVMGGTAFAAGHLFGAIGGEMGYWVMAAVSASGLLFAALSVAAGKR